jgi:adenylate kinase
MKENKKAKGNVAVEAQALAAQAAEAEKWVDIARQKARSAKAEYKAARKEFKKAKKAAKDARKAAKAAAKGAKPVAKKVSRKAKAGETKKVKAPSAQRSEAGSTGAETPSN